MTKDDAIKAAFAAFGSTEIQISDAVLLLGSRITEKAGQFVFNGAASHDVPLDNFSVFKKTMQTEKPHLLPRAFESSVADRAFIDGSLKARGELIAQVGEIEAHRIALSYGLNGVGDTRRARAAETDEIKKGNANNPWADHPQNLDKNGRYSAAAIGRQSALVKINEVAAAEIAAAVGNKIGDTMPKRRRAFA
jgi:hypothetical protein